MILHIAERDRWQATDGGSDYTPARFADEGFVHCSDPEQVTEVANRLFRGCEGLVLLVIEEKRLTAPVRRENLEGGSELFPHVYGAIPRDAVFAVWDLVPDDTGRLSIPDDLRGLGG